MRVLTAEEEYRHLLRVATDADIPPEGEDIDPTLEREIDQNDDLIPQTLWPQLRRASTYHVDKRILELATSPYVGRSEPVGA